MTYRTELLSGFVTEADDDPDTRIWMTAETPAADDDQPGHEFILDDDGDYIEAADPESPLVWGGHQGEVWLGGWRDAVPQGDWWDATPQGHYVWQGGQKIRKPRPLDAALYCKHCRWPLPLRWSWSACEFGEPRISLNCFPEMGAVLEDDPLLYRVAPWVWQFCHCNGCLDLSLSKGRPPEYCSDRCRRDADNARDRERRILNRFTAKAA